MISLLRKILELFRRIIGIKSLKTQMDYLKTQIRAINNKITWVQDYHCIYTDITTAVPSSGIMLLQQQAGAKILEIFDMVCSESQLSYWLGAGNLLGFVRNNRKPLPWDDDVDVYMPRSDFEQAVNILPKLFSDSDILCVYRGFSIVFFKYKNAMIRFDIFPIDKFHKKIESSEEMDLLYKKICINNIVPYKDFIMAAGFNNFKEYFMSLCSGEIIDKYEELFEKSETVKKYWDTVVMDGKKPASNGHLLIGYERAIWNMPELRYSWNYDYVFPLKRMEYFGVETNIPNNPNLYLISQYGNYWTFPKNFKEPGHDHTDLKLTPETIDSLMELKELNASEFVRNLKRFP